MPVVISNVQQKIKEERVSNIRHKFSKATDAMLSSSGMNGYTSTMEFVQEFKRHFKIAKICDNNNIADCWPTKTITNFKNGTTSEWKISDTKTSKNLRMPEGVSVDWDNPVGIITADGVGMILTYNKKCDKSAMDGLNWAGDTSSSSTCIAAVFDWNGGKKPNRIGDLKNNDIFSINAFGLGNGCIVFEAGGRCMTSVQKSSPLSNTSKKYWTNLGIKAVCLDENGNSCGTRDYWGGAAETCGHVNNLPTEGELADLASHLYQDGKFSNKELALAIGISEINIEKVSNGSNNNGFRIWLNEEHEAMNRARATSFFGNQAKAGTTIRTFAPALTVCMGS